MSMKKQIKMELIDKGIYIYFYHQKGNLDEKQVSKVEDGYNKQQQHQASMECFRYECKLLLRIDIWQFYFSSCIWKPLSLKLLEGKQG